MTTKYCRACFSGLENDYMFCPECGERTDAYSDVEMTAFRKREATAHLAREKYAEAKNGLYEMIEDGTADLECYLLYLRSVTANYTDYDAEGIKDAIDLVEEAHKREGAKLLDADAFGYIGRYTSRAKRAEKKSAGRSSAKGGGK